MSGRAGLEFVWVLAVDFGTTATAAAMREPDGRVAGLVLPDGTSTMPSSVLADPTGVLVGTKADNAAGYALDRYQPTPKRDIGRASVLLGTTEFRPCTLIAAVYAAIIGEAVRQHNHRPPEQLVLTHPVDWSDRRLDVLREAVSLAADQLGIPLPDPTFVPEPVAAATHYAHLQAFNQPTAPITTSTVSPTDPSEDAIGDEYFAVYDLGGGTFDVTVLCRSSSGFEVLATGGIDPLGGFEFDNRLFNYLGQTHYRKADPTLWQALAHPDPEDPDSGTRRRFLDATVRQVKEELSEHTQRTVHLPGLPEPVLVTRTEFENLIRTDLDATIAELEATLARAGLTPDQLTAIYRIGGASRIPLVGSLLDQLQRPVRVVDHPKTVVALGAAIDSAGSVEPEVADDPTTVEQPEVKTDLLATVPVSVEGARAARKRRLRRKEPVHPGNQSAPAIEYVAPTQNAAPAPPVAATQSSAGIQPTPRAAPAAAKLASPRIPFILAGLLAAMAVGFAALSAPSSDATVQPGTLTVAGVDPAVGIPVIDLTKPVAITVTNPDGDRVALAWDVVGLTIGRHDAPLRPGGQGAMAEVRSPVHPYLMAGRLTAIVTVLRGQNVVATYRFAIQSTQPATTTAVAITTVVLALFALAFLESGMRALRQGRDRVTATIGVPVSAAALALAGLTAVWILTGRQPATETVLGSVELAAAAGIAAAMGARRVGRAYRSRRASRAQFYRGM